MAINNYKKITFEDMVEYIEKNAPKDKAWFKETAMVVDKKGKVVVLNGDVPILRPETLKTLIQKSIENV